MNINTIKFYIKEYKDNFESVHNKEIYKWEAVKHFQHNFDINASNFSENLETSLNKTANLLGSGNYYPRKMLVENAKKSPEQVREMFRFLFDEDFDIIERIESFRSDFEDLNLKNFKDLDDYQDHRAVIVYLNLKFPERYFFYKFTMFKKFAYKINYSYKPVGGRTNNIGQFFNVCELVKYEIEKDQELLRLHEKRLTSDSYYDKKHNILTQDFIYATVKYLNTTNKSFDKEPTINSSNKILSTKLNIELDEINFKPQRTNFIQNNIDNKRIGDLGELWVLENEIEFLRQNGKSNLANKVNHVSVNEGDGLGFDILSFNLDGSIKFIEVKTTKGRANSTFYITRNELEKSKLESSKYHLYRVFNFKEENQTGELLEINGSLTSICQQPLNYKVNLKN